VTVLPANGLRGGAGETRRSRDVAACAAFPVPAGTLNRITRRGALCPALHLEL
jgi:hypothetical protein